MPETPESYLKRYLPISVDGICGRTYVEIRTYKSSFASANGKYRKAAYEDFRDFVTRTGKYADDDHGADHVYWGQGWVYSARMYPTHWAWIDLDSLKAMFQGVGRPEDFRRILRLADLYLGTADWDAGQMKDLGWSNRMFSLQQWADWYIGTDCRGFVGAYLNEAYPHIKDGNDLSFSIDSYDDYYTFNETGTSFRRIDDAREVARGDLLVKCSLGGGRHVAVVDQVLGSASSQSIRIRTAESRGGKGLCQLTGYLSRLHTNHVENKQVRQWKHYGCEYSLVLKPR